jgi:hypothetical protein
VGIWCDRDLGARATTAIAKVSGDREMNDDVNALVRCGARRAGSPEGHAAEKFLFEKLVALGLHDVRKEPIAVTAWNANETRFTITSEEPSRDVDAFAIPYCAFTPKGGIEGTLLYADPAKPFFALPDDCRGAIVVTDVEFPALDPKLLRAISVGIVDTHGDIDSSAHAATWVRRNWHFYRESVKRGARAFIGILKDQPGGTSKMYAPYGFREKDILDKPLPGAWVGRDDGASIRAIAKAGGSARLTITGTRAPGTTHNIVGEIPGTIDETIVISCHHDSPFASPVEDASGCAVVLALAKKFAHASGRRRIVILFSAGHFYGSIGTRTFLREHKNDIVKNTALEISIEHIANEAIEDASGHLVASGRPEPAGVFVPWSREVTACVHRELAAHDVDRAVLLTPEGPLGDYPPTDGGDWYEAGVPVINFISNPVYLLTDDDALEWVAWDRMPKVANAFEAIVRAVDLIPREIIGLRDREARRIAMRMLTRYARAKTTWFGTRPVY